MSQYRLAHPVTLAVIPFLLLSSARTVTVRSTVYLDGSVKRVVTAEFLQERRDSVVAQLRRALPEADSREVVPVGEGLKAVWSVILSSARALDGADLRYQDVVSAPLSLFTYYTYTETVEIPSETATEVEKAEPGKAVFKYVVTMPGTVREATARPKALEKTTPEPARPAASTPSSATPPPGPGPAAGPAPAPGPAPTTPAPSATSPAAPAAAAPGAPPAPAAPVPAPTPVPAAPTGSESGAMPAPPTASSAGPSPGAPEVPATPPAAPVSPPETVSPPQAPSAESAPLPPKQGAGPSLAAESEGSTATFALSAEHEAYDISVTSRRVRWGYLAVILYILAFIAYRIAAFVVHRARVRPRRI